MIFLVNIHGLFVWKIKKVQLFQNISNDSKRKPNKTWVDKGSELYNRSIKSWLQDNDTEMCSIHKNLLLLKDLLEL